MVQDDKHFFGLLFWLHIVVAVLCLLSPFLFDWLIIVVGVALFYAQWIVLGGCVLTRWEFGKDSEDNDETFFSIYFRRIGLALDPIIVKFIIRKVMPALVLGVSLLWQVVLGKTPLLISLF